MQLLELVSDTCRINEEQIVHGVPEGAPKEDYKLSTLVVAIVASILPCSLIYDPFLGQGVVATATRHPRGFVTLTGLGRSDGMLFSRNILAQGA